uniref:ATP-dependent Clp protease proteolytic subunit n=1 Tax=Silene chalcedonica TaxID=39855 RepID=B0LN89_SILCH|nr:clp protease proteolytic subunit [Silene chalcedonica]ABY85464.1 ATP-dependent protease proteolytic subunit [Silene chalcedonica]AGZ18112.1 clp protease proteolytic subunit [Silene chalcedonica]
MPVGVPKISFLIKEEEEEEKPKVDWLDFYHELHKRRLLFLCQDFNYEIVNQIAGLLLFLHLEDEDKQQHLFIHSRGGLATHAMAIYDTMQLVTLGVHTIGMGVVASMATLLLAGGAYTKRNAYAHTRIMLHLPATRPFKGTASEVLGESKEVLRLTQTLVEILEERTGRPQDLIYKDMQKTTHFSAEEAQAYGIIDEIGLGEIKLDMEIKRNRKKRKRKMKL